jgi:hypothetical protein
MGGDAPRVPATGQYTWHRPTWSKTWVEVYDGPALTEKPGCFVAEKRVILQRDALKS